MISYFWKGSETKSHITPSGLSDSFDSLKEKTDDDISPEIDDNNKEKKSKISLLLKYIESGFNHFLQVSFTAFWPLQTHQHVIMKIVSLLSIVILPILQLCIQFTRINKEWTSFRMLSILILI